MNTFKYIIGYNKIIIKRLLVKNRKDTKEKMKNSKGVTLVALVVTIVVLIILAGISINLILGDNGIITIAKKAKENTELAKIEEETELNELYTQLEAEGGNSSGESNDNAIEKLAEFKKAIANAIGDAGGIKPEFSAETSVFENNIKEIVKEVTKNATATEEDIIEGKTAWIKGEEITGTLKSSLPVGSSAEVIYSKVYYGNIRDYVYTFKKDYDNVIVVTQSHNPHSTTGYASNAYIKQTTVEDKTIINNLLFSGTRQNGEAIAVAILRNVKAGDTIKTYASYTSSLSIISL